MDHSHDEKQPRFCLYCGSPLERREAYEQTRLCCTQCDYIHFDEPKVVVAMIPERDGQILLLKRVMNPGKGKWTYPSGFVEAGEELEAAALRETREETHAEVQLKGLVGVYSRAGDRIVFVVYHGDVVGGDPTPGSEATEVGFFSLDRLPELAFERDYGILKEWRARFTTKTLQGV